MVKPAFRMLISSPSPTASSSSCIKGAPGGGLWKIPNSLGFSSTGPHLYYFLKINNVIQIVFSALFYYKMWVPGLEVQPKCSRVDEYSLVL